MCIRDRSATIAHGNALRIDWQSLIDPLPWEKKEQKFDFIFGNPPFVGKQMKNTEQKQDIDSVFQGVKGAGVLDYVSCWYIKAAQYLQKTKSNGIQNTLCCLLYTSDAADERSSVDLGGRRIIKKKNHKHHTQSMILRK